MSGRVLITGAHGRLGSALLSSPRFAGARSTAHVDADLADLATASRLVEGVDTVVHTVAITDVDRCEREVGEAFRVNVATTLSLARALAVRRGVLVYISTDQVYSGTGPHREEDAAPLNVYGLTKHAGEMAARVEGRSLVLRTNFVGPSRNGNRSWSEWIVESARTGSAVDIHPGAIFSTLHVDDLVEIVAACLDAGLEGVYNAGSHGSVRKVDFARTLAEAAVPGGGDVVTERATVDATRAVRPLDLALDVAKLEAVLGRTLPTPESVLRRLQRESALAA